MTAALFDSMFNHVFFNPASLFVFALFAGVWWTWSLQHAVANQSDNALHSNRKHRIYAIGVALLASCVLVWSVRWGASQWYIGHTQLHPSQQRLEYDLSQAIRLNPYNFRALSSLAQLAYIKEDYTTSLMLLEQLVSIAPYNAVILNQLALLHIAAGNRERAAKLLQRALRVQPDFEPAKENWRRLGTQLTR